MPLDIESYAEPEIVVAAAVTAAAASPSLRKVVRKSMIYGVAGLLIAYDKVSTAAQEVVKGLRKRMPAAAETKPGEAAAAAAPSVEVAAS